MGTLTVRVREASRRVGHNDVSAGSRPAGRRGGGRVSDAPLVDDVAVVLPAAVPATGPRERQRDRGELVRRFLAPVAVVAVVASFAVSAVVGGLPLDRLTITLWCLGLVVAAGLGRPLRTLLARTAGWVLVYVAFLVYDLGRGVADALGVPVDETWPMWGDRLLTGVVPTVWLQERLYAETLQHWFHAPLALLYMSHFFAAYAVMIVLQVRRPARFWPFVSAWIVTTYVALAMFLVHPSAPPWMVARDGGMPAVRRTATIGLADLDLHFAARLVDMGRVTLNQVAAFPSLHSAYPALLLFFFWGTSRWWTRVLLVAYPVAMGFMLVLCAEHWVVDVLAGWTVAGLSVLLVRRLERRLAQRRAARRSVGEPTQVASPA